MTVAFTRAGSVAASPPQGAASKTSDDTLIGRIAGGDQLAMRTLFARHRVPLYRWLLRLVRDEALAEDLLSDVFLDVWRQAASFEGRASVSTWLLAIARHKALSARRRRIDAKLDAEIASTIADPADDPEAALQKKKRGELLRKSLARLLSPEHGEVIDLVYYHGKSGRDRRRRRGHGQDAHVLCTQEVGRARCSVVAAVPLPRQLEPRTRLRSGGRRFESVRARQIGPFRADANSSRWWPPSKCNVRHA
jgi:RNA polymerase sigma-70 factor, ECF subfamily